MSLPYITDQYRITFPDPEDSEDGIVCYGGNLSPGVLLSAFEQGVFPWYKNPGPIIWWSPDPRFVMLKEDFHVPKRLKRYIKKTSLDITVDKAFYRVITGCAEITRKNQDGTWITPEMKEAYCELNRLGYAHSIEAWNKDFLAGGLYGVLMGNIFIGESMFSRESNASHIALVRFAESFFNAGGRLIDSQVYTENISAYGGRNISRQAYLRLLKDNLENSPSLTKLFNPGEQRCL